MLILSGVLMAGCASQGTTNRGAGSGTGTEAGSATGSRSGSDTGAGTDPATGPGAGVAVSSGAGSGIGGASGAAPSGAHSGATGTASSAAAGHTSAAPSSGASTSASASGPGSVAGKDATVIVGVGKVRVVIYEDYRCPVCKQVHDQIQPVISSKLGAGSIKVEFHAVDLIDHNTGGKGSLAAGNAASCALQAFKFQPYREALFAAQPSESTDAFADPNELISIAKTVSGLDSPTFEDCVRTQPYGASIDSTYAAEYGSGKLVGVPSVFINGTQWNVPTSGGMATSFTQALAAAGA
ncbi:protein-disulfide isomerase [Catenulispora sp. GAS73]|uniref:DsbA family protein n=1 Tax=Catenulispora sp. GAS73 TaxID=3156269 RepID=UPI003514CC57